ncbi:MAG TPA: AHH domain-containing protein, partial [Polyangium sp.]|nr:AHH domain-containing protein [Polyangium sp.]
KRLENVPIFIPVANGGMGTVVRAGTFMGSVSAKMHRYYLENALKKPPFNVFRKAGQALHHIVAHGDHRAAGARKKLASLKIDIDEAWNGVFLPATPKSPNPTGAIVHSMLHTDEYYFTVERLLQKAKSRKEGIQVLRKIRESLENGTF